MPLLLAKNNLAVTRYKLAALLDDAEIRNNHSDLAALCVQAILSIESKIMTLEKRGNNTVHEDKYEQARN